MEYRRGRIRQEYGRWDGMRRHMLYKPCVQATRHYGRSALVWDTASWALTRLQVRRRSGDALRHPLTLKCRAPSLHFENPSLFAVHPPDVFALWSSAICARAASTSSALVLACPASPHPPSTASVSSTQVRFVSDASPAAAATRSVN